jgi:hypothetical protein
MEGAQTLPPKGDGRRPGRVSITIGTLFLAYAFAGNYLALPGYLRFLERGRTSAAGNALDLAVVIGAVKTAVWMFSFQLGLLFFALGVLKRAGVETKQQWIFIACGAGWFLFAGIPAFPGPYAPFFAIFGLGILLSVGGLLYCWGRARPGLDGERRTAHDLRLVGYLFFALATWDVCGLGSTGRMLHPEQVVELGTRGLLVTQTTKIMIEFSAAWAFAALAHR